MKKPFVILTTTVSALALAGAVGAGVASAAPAAGSSPAPSTSATPTAGSTSSTASRPGQGTAGKHRDLARRALHGELTLGGKEHRVVDVQRGTVTAVSADSLSVRSADGFVGTYVVASTTHVRVAKKVAAIADVAAGDHVRVVSLEDGQTLTATRVADRTR